MTKTVTGRRASSWEMWKADSGPERSAVMMELARATVKQVNATTMVQYHLYALDQFLGFLGSLSLKVTRL